MTIILKLAFSAPPVLEYAGKGPMASNLGHVVT